MGKGKKGWQTRGYIWVGLSSLTSWFLWKSFKRTRKVFPLKSLQGGMVLSTSSFLPLPELPQGLQTPPRQSSDVQSEGLQCPHVPRGSHHKARLWATWCPPYSPCRPLVLRQWLRQQQFLSPDYRKVLPSSKGTGLLPSKWVRMVHIWIQNCHAINFYQKAQMPHLFDKRIHWSFSKIIIFCATRLRQILRCKIYSAVDCACNSFSGLTSASPDIRVAELIPAQLFVFLEWGWVPLFLLLKVFQVTYQLNFPQWVGWANVVSL